mgnify:CR=1 FL=1
MQLNVLLYPDSALRTTCIASDDVTDELRDLALNMVATMYTNNGIGLAAPQIGNFSRTIVINQGTSSLIMFNPKIVEASADEKPTSEGCLSFPGQYVKISRPSDIVASWMDMNGNEQKESFSGMASTCIQHEIDHLDKKLIIDYAKPLKRELIEKKMRNRK